MARREVEAGEPAAAQATARQVAADPGRRGQVEVDQGRPGEGRGVEPRPAQVDAGEPRVVQTGTGEVGGGQGRLAREPPHKPIETGDLGEFSRIDPKQSHLIARHLDPIQACAAQVGPREVASQDAAAVEPGTNEPRARELCPIELRPAQVDPIEVRPPQVEAGEHRASERLAAPSLLQNLAGGEAPAAVGGVPFRGPRRSAGRHAPRPSSLVRRRLAPSVFVSSSLAPKSSAP